MENNSLNMQNLYLHTHFCFFFNPTQTGQNLNPNNIGLNEMFVCMFPICTGFSTKSAR
jgi:hypothetical protein